MRAGDDGARVASQRLLPRVARRVGPPGTLAHQREVHDRMGVGGIQLGSTLQLSLGFVVTTELHQRRAEPVVRRGDVRPVADRSSERFLGVAQRASCHQKVAELDPHRSVVGCFPQGGPVVLEGAIRICIP